MELLTQELRQQLPPLYATAEQDDPLVVCMFFIPLAQWSWYPTEFDGEDTFFGLVIGHEAELGYFSLAELESIKGPFGLTIERDLYFKPTRLSIIRNKVERR